MIVPPVATLDAIGRRSLARTLREGRRRHTRAPSPRRRIYLLLPGTTLLNDRYRRARVEDAYTSTGSIEVVAAVLATEAQYLAGRQAAGNLDEALARRAWTSWVAESDLDVVAEAISLGYLVHTPPTIEPVDATE